MAAKVGGFQIRIEYMNTNILLFRVNSLDLTLYDEWCLKDVIQQWLNSTKHSKLNTSTKQDQYSSLTINSETNDVLGSLPVFIRIVGEINWDQAQVRYQNALLYESFLIVHAIKIYW